MDWRESLLLQQVFLWHKKEESYCILKMMVLKQMKMMSMLRGRL